MGIKFNKKQLKLIETMCDAANGDLMNCADCWVAPYKKELQELRQMFVCEGMDVQTSEKDLTGMRSYCQCWVSVKERLPELCQIVLCVQDPDKTATKEPLYAIFDGEGFMCQQPMIFANYEIGKSRWSDIIKWMPLPDTN